MASLFVALTGLQMEALQHDGKVWRSWFGEFGASTMIPAKRTAQAAARAFFAAVGQQPEYILRFTMPLQTFYDMVDSGVMVTCLHVNGYRIYTDIALHEAAGWDWTFHPVDAWRG